jgi:DNA-directed RNA polymerase beta subunit
MPKTEDGRPLDACLNPLAIFNRLIPSASVEHELDHICTRMVQYIDSHQVIEFPDRDGDILTIDLTDYCRQGNMSIERAKIYAFAELFLRQTSAKQYTQWQNVLLHAREDEVAEMWNEMVTDRVYILQEPFYDNVSKDNLWYLYDILEYLYPNRSHLYKLDCSMEPLIVARSYFIKLKHEPLSKFSARSLSSVNAKMIPSKNGMQYKSYKALYNTLPVRKLMRTLNLFN